jgi:indole-3-glycerol phosphate synthase
MKKSKILEILASLPKSLKLKQIIMMTSTHLDMWLACHTQEEIAEAEDVDQTTVTVKAKDFMNFGQVSKNHKTIVEHMTDFETPILARLDKCLNPPKPLPNT